MKVEQGGEDETHSARNIKLVAGLLLTDTFLVKLKRGKSIGGTLLLFRVTLHLNSTTVVEVVHFMAICCPGHTETILGVTSTEALPFG